MNLVIPVGQKRTQSAATPPASHGRAPFSRASHFGNILLPVVLAVAYALIRDYRAGFTESDHSLWLQLFAACMVVAGLGGSVLLLRVVEKVELSETEPQAKH